MMMAVGRPSNQPGGDPPKKRRSAFCRELSGRFLMEYRWAFCCTFHWELLWCHVEETNVDPFQVSAAIDLKVSSFSVSWYIFDMMALWNHGIMVSWYHAGIMVPLSSLSPHTSLSLASQIWRKARLLKWQSESHLFSAFTACQRF